MNIVNIMMKRDFFLKILHFTDIHPIPIEHKNNIYQSLQNYWSKL